MLNRHWVCFRNRSPKVKIFISGNPPRDEYYSVNWILIREINTIVKYKCAFYRFSFIGKEQGWIDNNNKFDLSHFYEDKLHLIHKGNIKLSESIITSKKDTNIGQNTLFNEMAYKKHNQLMEAYKTTVSFKFNHADFPPLLILLPVSLFLLFRLRFHPLLY